MRLELPEPISQSSAPDLGSKLVGASSVSTAAGPFQFARYRLTEGASRDVELLVVDSGNVRAAICPTRGMSLWKARIAGIDCGWKSPVEGPIHPSLVPLGEPSGLGWLDGFDELLVRCGLRSFGAPDFGEDGQLQFALHGRAGNLPARHLRLELDEAHSLLHVFGDVFETRFLQYNLKMTVKYTLAIGETAIHIHDVVTNAGATPTGMQMLYHINLGQPLLEAGASLHVDAKKAVARNAHAASSLASWPTYEPPTAGYSEQVYFFAAVPDASGWAKALLAARNSERGFAVHYRPDSLPYFTQWKNTVAESDGYVTGLEPGTGFPNPRSFEEKQGRVIELAPGESREFHLKLEGIAAADRVKQLKQEIESTRSGPMATSDFEPGWCVPGS